MFRTYVDAASAADTRRLRICRNLIFCEAGKRRGVLHNRNVQREQCLSHHRTTRDHLLRLFLKAACSFKDLAVAHAKRNLEVLRVCDSVTSNRDDLTDQRCALTDCIINGNNGVYVIYDTASVCRKHRGADLTSACYGVDQETLAALRVLCL